MKDSGWVLIDSKTLKVGDVIVWEVLGFRDESHSHIGFAVSAIEVVINSAKFKTPLKHKILETDGDRREVVEVYRKII